MLLGMIDSHAMGMKTPNFQPIYNNGPRNTLSPWMISIPASMYGRRIRRSYRTKEAAEADATELRKEFEGVKAKSETRRREFRPENLPWIYFLRSGEYLKIGYSARLLERLEEHKGSNPNIELLAILPGTRLLETCLHGKLKHLRAHKNEWYRLEGPLKAFVDSLTGLTALGYPARSKTCQISF
jgi:hypothetical protein